MKIRVEGVSKYFSGTPALQDVDLQIDPGAFIVVSGPNGAGKTTLLRVLDLLLTPDQGDVAYDGRSARSLTHAGIVGLRRRMAYVDQSPVMFSGSVEWNAAYGLRARGIRGAAGAVREGLRSVGLEKFAGASARHLSCGETQRLALARALVLSPEVLFLDEPGANIDAESAAIVSTAIQSALAAGASVVLVTHTPGAFASLTPAVVTLRGGRVTSSP